MLEDLEIGEAQVVEPEKMARKKQELPFNLAAEWDRTPLGEARRITVKSKTGADPTLVGRALISLLKLYARSQGLVAFKASATPTTEGLSLYWQKKPGRGKKPEPAIEPMPSEPVTSKPKRGGDAR